MPKRPNYLKMARFCGAMELAPQSVDAWAETETGMLEIVHLWETELKDVSARRFSVSANGFDRPLGRARDELAQIGIIGAVHFRNGACPFDHTIM